MSLQTLPVEILCMIIRYIGSDQLRKQESCCLAVFKVWYQIAKRILLEDLRISAIQLVQAPDNQYPTLRTSLRRLILDIHGPEDWPAEQDIERLNHALISVTEKSDHLTSFTLLVRRNYNPRPRPHYASTWNPTPFFNVLGASKISHLVIDTWGSNMTSSVHICPRLALQLPSLKSLCLRMYSICTEVLEFPRGDSATPSRIESIIINLSPQDSQRMSKKDPEYCNGRRLLYHAMASEGTKIAKQMPSLKVFRILRQCHAIASMDCTNCITGIETTIAGTGDLEDRRVVEPDEASRTRFSWMNSDFSS
ncbi:hypothetical protein N7517_010911 [Penicillium concentricum]|uniref:F-box domain-containing protein n=1 Tax=Penicillium concentricum TaxID=293559 RepID=A0A9W9R9W0_9EURO|nr:uncharacterized protein N7517_010911 [Penicillium concentricum]KAJ5356302.1 hypothetical protein N7517_010911 [Penicillium concentricum]